MFEIDYNHKGPGKRKSGLSVGEEMKRCVIVMDKRKGDKEFPSATACAVALNVSPSTVRNHCRSGEVLESKVGPVRIRYKEES